MIQNNLDRFTVDSMIVEKRKTDPTLQEKGKFYVTFWGFLMKAVLERYVHSSIKRLLIFTDPIPVEKDRKTAEKAMKTTVHRHLDKKIKYFLYHHASKSNFHLQVVDYINWAIYRKWEACDLRSYDLIKRGILFETEFPGEDAGRG